jgi:phytoene dehydrogenase-like protein
VTALVTDLCPEGTFPPEYVSAVTERVPCCSAVIGFAGLDIDLRERGVTDFEIYRSWGETRTSELINEISSTADYSRLPTASVSVYSNVDPGCCPPGKSVISTLSFADPELFEEALEGGKKRGAKYKELKKKISAQLIQNMARALDIPDLESHIEVFELATPVTLKRYTRNRGGSFVGWSYTPDQGALDGLPQGSPVPNLFLCGQWVMPGGGVAPVIASGANAATLAADYLSG